ncbi:hypothetical protein QFC22_000375 [Naganishia vaughanmartiniae]|uniref:Uncharacterized protein n=1 Tax=Naganishia vaughanmartiniae TaxID=1424756 RepID=A0ACC2XPX5_9TREE|nr:hypothetical protein QFC22_000375 [Naganishia vaughanmartiniae]
MVAVPANMNMSDRPSKNKPRKRVNTAEKRASHNLVERQRREQLNGRFLDLARLLPSLATQKRPSKSAIVNGSIHHLTDQRNARLIAARELRALFTESQDMLKELNEYRVQAGKESKTFMGWTEGMREVVKVEDETFGTFTSFDEDGPDGQDGGDNDDGDVDYEGNVVPQFDMGHVNTNNMYGGNLSMPGMHGAFPHAVMFMHNNAVKQEHERQRMPSALNRQSSFSSSSASPQEEMSAQQQAMMMMRHAAFSGQEFSSSSDDISPSAIHGPIAASDMMAGIGQEYLMSPQTGNGYAFNGMNDMAFGDKVSTWTQQQQMLFHMAQQRRGTVPGHANQSNWMDSGMSQSIGALAATRSQSLSQYPNNTLPSQLTAAHVTLLARQPHLAAAVFPPACSTEFASSAGLPEYNFDAARVAMLSQHNASSGNAFEQWQKAGRPLNYSMPSPPIPSSMPSAMMNVHATPTSTTSGSSPSSMIPPTVSELREAVRVGMGIGLGMPTWTTEMESFA